jgi:hypothetical protein
LKDDLSNAIIATCKGPHVARNTPVVDPVTGPPTPKARSAIYDPVWKTHVNIPDTEHQVQQLQHGKINRTDETVGPLGDFYTNWTYNEDGAGNQPF